MTETKIALVTGANKGIGYEIAAQLAALGMTVVIGARDAHRREQAAKELNAESVALDVTEPETARQAAAWIDERFGKLDVLVNNAGITGGWGQEPSKVPLDVMRRVFDTNVFGVITVTNAVLPLLSRSAGARIVNVSSGVGSLTEMTGQYAAMPAGAAYPVSKTALNALTVQYAKELRESGILVNATDPGYCDTDLTEHKGFRTPAQGAAISVRLATIGDDGPTGRFFNDEGEVAW
ncbi:SDR family oxidoreductase [Kibdelosporangium phytohabitans]|uniref:Dehydrogenase n=1 Tax=Kibdelosporangium phytohabitans TaxID=860235 RepID=A0A0N7F4U3_9PSEU|nr:SDR family oxidoreductase [Kibdelosporangium phytohabitans]ALG12391.1 dehydrogenase [Kibdelosporangium phytohabitans]MBE1463969.1 NAD(P)-dependent dehydrogenase (short-subunit alcohol dehydrogenase family) [Kibdelosporangium phytohabitans]